MFQIVEGCCCVLRVSTSTSYFGSEPASPRRNLLLLVLRREAEKYRMARLDQELPRKTIFHACWNVCVCVVDFGEYKLFCINMSDETMDQYKNSDCRDKDAIPMLEVLSEPPTDRDATTCSNIVVLTETDKGLHQENQSTGTDPTMKKPETTATSAEAIVAMVSSTEADALDITTKSLLQQESQQMSKNQLKKRRRMEKAIEIKQRKKQQKKQVRYERAKAQGRDIDTERIQQEEARILSATNSNRIKRIQEWQQKMRPKMQQSYQICIDCSYESYMTPKEINSLAIQIRYCYSSNKHSAHPCQLTATSMGCNDTKNNTNTNDNTRNSSGNNNNYEDQTNCITLNHLRKVNGFDEWSNYAFQVTSDSFDQYFQDKIQKVVYLTSDSENTITTLENDKIYVIGGIVDRNRYKQLTYQRAIALGIATAKLPIDEYLSTMPSTRVLTTNHVFDLLVKYKEHNGCWKKALADVLPIRKDAKFVEEENESPDDK